MAIKQLSVFLENKSGSLLKLTQTLKLNGVNLRALCIADTYDFGIARFIVDQPDSVADMLRNNNYVVNVANVMAVEISDNSGSLCDILEIMDKNQRNVEYMYGFTGKKTNNACMIIRPTNIEIAEKVLVDAGMNLLDENTLKNI